MLREGRRLGQSVMYVTACISSYSLDGVIGGKCLLVFVELFARCLSDSMVLLD